MAEFKHNYLPKVGREIKPEDIRVCRPFRVVSKQDGTVCVVISAGTSSGKGILFFDLGDSSICYGSEEYLVDSYWHDDSGVPVDITITV